MTKYNIDRLNSLAQSLIGRFYKPGREGGTFSHSWYHARVSWFRIDNLDFLRLLILHLIVAVEMSGSFLTQETVVIALARTSFPLADLVLTSPFKRVPGYYFQKTGR